MIQNTNLKEIGKLFAQHRYIVNGTEIQQYNRRAKKFQTVPNQEVLDIFNKLYIDFERKPITLNLLTPYLPKITNKQLETYNICKELETTNLKDHIDQEIAGAIETNNKKKIDIPGKIPATDYQKQIQFLINNDVFTNGKSFYKCNDGAIKFISAKEVSQIIKPHIIEFNSPFNPIKLLQFAIHHLTKINIDFKKKNIIENLNDKDWQKYQEIDQLLSSYKEQ